MGKADFSGKTVLVTGASSGLGKACVQDLDASGATTVLVARRKECLEDVASTLIGEHKVFCCDVSQDEQIDRLFRSLNEHNMKLDGIVHAAGIAPNIPISLYSFEEAQRVFRVNFFSFCLLLRYCSKRKYMNLGGSIVAVSSSSVLRGNKTQGLYCASKSALEAYIRIAAKELADKKIRVNAIQPAALDTPLTAATFNESPVAQEHFEAVQRLRPDRSERARRVCQLFTVG